MFLTCEIFCEDYVKEPSYRLYINDELMVERDFVIPSDIQFRPRTVLETIMLTGADFVVPSDIYSHYEFGADLDLPDGTNTIAVESVKGTPEFILGVVTINNKKTSCTNGKFMI